MLPELRDQAQGRWRAIFSHFDEAAVTSGRNIPCPFCGGKDRFRFCDYDKGFVICNQCMPNGCDGVEYLMRRTGYDFREIASKIRQIIGETPPPAKITSERERAKRSLNRIWLESMPITPGCIVANYLQSRSVALPDSGDIRQHAALAYYTRIDEKVVKMGSYPAMVSKVRNSSGEPATLHCTYLTAGGLKAPVDTPRKVKPSSDGWKGGFVFLQKGTGGPLVVSEGIETCLAYLKTRPECSGFAALSASNLREFIPPFDDERAIIIAGDHDTNFTGQAAAYHLANRLSLKIKNRVIVDIPNSTGDWCDVVD